VIDSEHTASRVIMLQGWPAGCEVERVERVTWKVMGFGVRAEGL